MDVMLPVDRVRKKKMAAKREVNLVCAVKRRSKLHAKIAPLTPPHPVNMIWTTARWSMSCPQNIIPNVKESIDNIPHINAKDRKSLNGFRGFRGEKT